MKKLLPLLLMLISAKLSFSQAVAGKVDYQKSSQPASIIELPYNPDLIEAALKDFLGKKGVKESSSKGFSQYRGVQLAAADPTLSDLYFKIDRKSRKEREISVVYLVVTKPGENPSTRSSEDNYGTDQAKNFLNDIGPSIEAYSLDQNIKGQDDVVKKAEKKLNNLVDDGKDLEKQKKRIEDKIQDNIKDQDNQKNEVQKQKQALDALNSKRKS
jgi:hypothetical protein